MSKFSILVIFSLCCFSIVCYGQTFPKVQKVKRNTRAAKLIDMEPPSTEVFNMHINEQGWKFTEKVTFDNKKKTVVHHVPAHRHLSESYIMIEFSTNLTVTRSPSERACYVQPTSSEVESFDALKKGMETVSSGAYQMKPGLKVVRNFLKVIGLADLKTLSSDVIDFCRGMEIYEMGYENIQGTKALNAPRNKRSGSSGSSPQWISSSCYSRAVLAANWRKCSRSQRVMRCRGRSSGCFYYITCTQPSEYLRSGICTETHRTSDFGCCNPWCN